MVMERILFFMLVLVLDFIFGDPVSIPHPISYIGKMIKNYETLLRRTRIPLHWCGLLLLLLSLATVSFVISLLLFVAGLMHPRVVDLISIYLMYTSLAATCLKREVFKVYEALQKKDLSLARQLIGYLVGRDTTKLSESEIIRATVETTAENTVDGILAPMFYLGLGFLLGIPVQMVFIYKTINTLDSMVGYLQEPYREIGFFSAKTDDIANYLPARIGSICMLMGGGFLGYPLLHGWKILKRDRRNHKSPNCGYPEATVAGLLQVQIGGTNTYFNEVVYKPTIGDAVKPLTIEHIKATTRIMYASEFVLGMVCAVVLWSVK